LGIITDCSINVGVETQYYRDLWKEEMLGDLKEDMED
jgi:hypothetical protein